MKDITTELEILKATRKNIIDLISGHSLDQLNIIPTGFNNNLMWNFGHVIATQQLLIYNLSGLKMYADNDLIKAYRKGSRPTAFIEKAEYDEIMELAMSTVEDLEKDYQDELFQEYKIYTTSYNITLSTVEQAISFNNVHEALHLGTCLALRKFV